MKRLSVWKLFKAGRIALKLGQFLITQGCSAAGKVPFYYRADLKRRHIIGKAKRRGGDWSYDLTIEFKCQFSHDGISWQSRLGDKAWRRFLETQQKRNQSRHFSSTPDFISHWRNKAANRSCRLKHVHEYLHCFLLLSHIFRSNKIVN